MTTTRTRRRSVVGYLRALLPTRRPSAQQIASAKLAHPAGKGSKSAPLTHDDPVYLQWLDSLKPKLASSDAA